MKEMIEKQIALFQNKKSIETLKLIQNNGTIIFGAYGEMGSNISSTFLKANIPILMQDIDYNSLTISKNNLIKTLEKSVEKRKLTKKQYESLISNEYIKGLIVFPEKGKIPFDEISQGKESTESFVKKKLKEKEYENYTKSMLVLEAGPENLIFKQNIFQFFELALNSENAILATNTSSLKVSDIAKKVKYKERVVGFHYFLPAHINSLIEIIKGDETSEDTLLAMHNVSIAMGKKPIICFKDRPGAIANRILVGVLNEAAKLYDDGFSSYKEIDKIFLETFYSKQINIKTKKAQNQFQAAPKLTFFSDEVNLYKKIKEYEKKKDFKRKKQTIEILEGRLRQKVLYSQIVENLGELGSFFNPSPCVGVLKLEAQEQIRKIREYLNKVQNNGDYIKEAFSIKPYIFPAPKNKSAGFNKKQVSDRLKAAYLAISLEIYNEGLASMHDIELACKEGFKWNEGPFEIIYQLDKNELSSLLNLANSNLDLSKPTGIAKPNLEIKIQEEDISGATSIIENNIGFITLGRLHIQNFIMMQNSLSPQILNEINNAISYFETQNVKAIIIRSQGGGAFSSGADLNYIEGTNWDNKKILDYINLGKIVMDKIANSKIPTVAIVDGPAIGGGLELALACDYKIMTDQCFVALPEVSLGIIPDWGGTERLPAIVGKELAKRLICTATLKNMGLKLSAEDCYKLGLADDYILQYELPECINSLISGTSKINIFSKSKAKNKFNFSDYPENIKKRFNLTKPFKHNLRFFTRFPAILAEKLINNSDNANYSKVNNTDETSIKLANSGRRISTLYIKPMLYIVQNRFLAKLFEIFRLV